MRRLVFNVMGPLAADKRDFHLLQDVGLASIQIVHDLRNHLNGLKLYATFLRKRMETSERPPDELEAIAKLIAGLERTADDLTTLVRYGRPIELQKKQGVAFHKILSSLQRGNQSSLEFQLEMEDTSVVGAFDFVALSEALQSITNGALKMRRDESPVLIQQHVEEQSPPNRVLIEWRNIETGNRDVFHSLTGSDGLKLSLAAKIIEAHQGTVEQKEGALCVSLPIQKRAN